MNNSLRNATPEVNPSYNKWKSELMYNPQKATTEQLLSPTSICQQSVGATYLPFGKRKLLSFSLAIFVLVAPYKVTRNFAYGDPETTDASPQNGTVLPERKETLKQELEKGLQEAKRGNLRIIYDLHSRAREVLPYVKAYVNDSNDEVRKAVANIATSAMNKEGAAILSTLVGSKGDSRREAVYGLFTTYTPEQIRLWGGATLRKNLVQDVRNRFVTSEEMFLLSVFGSDKNIRNLFVQYRQRYKGEKTMIVKYEESPLVFLPFAVDVIL